MRGLNRLLDRAHTAEAAKDEVWSRRSWPGRIASTAIAAVSLSMYAPMVIRRVLRGQGEATVYPTALILAATGVLVVAVHLRLRGSHWTRMVSLFALQGMLYALILLSFADEWPFAELVIGWLLVICVPLKVVWPGFLAVTAVSVARLWSIPVFRILPEPDQIANSAYSAVSFLIIVGVVGCLVTLAQLGYQLRIARESVARLGALQERARMAQDLHDTIGLSLTAIFLQSEVADRELPLNVDLASRQLRSIKEGARAALEDMRKVARASRQPRFTAELAGAIELLEAAGAGCRLDADPQPDDQAAELLGWVLREAVTNVLRHSDASMCSIKLTRSRGQYRLMIENDGVRDSTNTDHSPGTGLSGLNGRLGRFGGRIETGVPQDGWFRLIATVPVEDERDVP